MSTVFFVFLALVAGLGFNAYLLKIFATAYNRRTWWERRANAYTNLIDALSDIVDYTKWHEGEANNEYAMLESKKNELTQAYKASIMRLRRAADSGQFLFSDEVVEALQQFQRDATGSQSDAYRNVIDKVLPACRKCLQVVVACSVRDLRLKE